MEAILQVVGLLTAFSLTVSAVNGQPFSNETNTIETESQSGTFLDCYSSFYSGMIFLKMFGSTNIDATEPN